MRVSKRFRSFIGLLLAFILCVPSVAFVQTAKATEEYEITHRKEAVPKNKVFKIKFNKELDYSTVNSNNIYVEDSKDKRVYTSVSIDSKNKKTILINPYNNYTEGNEYHIIIKNLKSKDGKKMSKNKKIYFTVNNVFAGLPSEDGLIIVEDIAYSVEYLSKNSSLVNEIVNKGFHIYYVYDSVEKKIKDIFGNIDISGSNKPTVHHDKMVYVNGKGDKSIYEWNSSISEYELVRPAVDAEVTVNSSAKVIMIKVKKVFGVEGAKYFKVQHSNSIKEIGESVVFTSTAINEKIEILSSSKIPLARGYLSLMYSSNGKKSINLLSNDDLGNTAGNINNNGYVAQDADGCLFLNNTDDRNKIYMIDTNGTFYNSICDDNAQYINTLNGWVYYSNYNDNGKIYKVKIDGTQRQRLNEDMSAYLSISGDWIYYSNHSDKGKLYKIRTDGTGRSRVSSAMVDETAYINVIGQWIYYTNKNDRHRPYVMNADGTYVCKLSEEWADSIQVKGDWVYYTSSTGVLCKVKKDGSGTVVPIMGQAREFDKGFHLNVVDNWIYYSNYKDGGKLYKIKTDGSGSAKKLTNESVDYINIVENTIFYTYKGKLYKLPLDTDGKIKGELVKKAGNDNKIIKMDDLKVTVPYYDVNLTLREIENKYLPEKVPGIKDDNTMHQFSVNWDRDRVSIRNGIRTYTGDVIGYNRKVKLELEIPSEMLNESNTITVYNNPDKGTDIVEVKNLYDNNLHANPPKLNIGDELKVYDNEDMSKLLGRAKVTRDGKYNKAVAERLELDSMGQKNIWITVTREGKGESRPTEVRQADMPVILTTKDKDDVGFRVDGRDFTIEEWLPSLKVSLNSYYVYMLPNRKRLDLSQVEKSQMKAIKGYGDVSSDETLYGVGNIKDFLHSSTKGASWTGTREMTKDSSFADMKKGKYDIFIAGRYNSLASSDNRGKCPSVIGYISSQPNTLDVASEEVPNKPTLVKQRVQGGTEINLPKPLLPGEKAYLVPVSTLNSISNWKTDDGFTEGQLNKSDSGNANGLEPSELGYDEATKKMAAPMGMRKGSDEYKDIECKLVYVNKVGASIASDYSIVVDNKVPVVSISEDYRSVRLGEKVKAQSDEDGKLYLVPWNNGTDVEELEAAVKSKSGKSVSVKSKVDYSLDTTGLEGKVNKNPDPETSANYKVVSVDEAGNISEITKENPVGVVVSTEVYKLDQLISEAWSAIEKIKESDIKSKLADAHRLALEVLKRAIENSGGATTVTQSEINRTFDKLKYDMMNLGISSRFGTIDEVMRAELNSLQSMTINEDTVLPTKSMFVKNDQDLSVNISWQTEKPADDGKCISVMLNNDDNYGQKVVISKYPVVKDKEVPLTATITVKKKDEKGQEFVKVSTKRIIVTVKHLELKNISILKVTNIDDKKANIQVKWDAFDKAKTNIEKYEIAVSESGVPKNIIPSEGNKRQGEANFDYARGKYICIGIVIEDEEGNKAVSEKVEYLSIK